MKTFPLSRNKEKQLQIKRLSVSGVLALLGYAVLFLLAVLFIPAGLTAPEEKYEGLLYINLEEVPEVVPDTSSTLASQEPAPTVTEQKPAAVTDKPAVTGTPGSDREQTVTPPNDSDQTAPEQKPQAEMQTNPPEETVTEKPEQSALDSSSLSELDKLLQNQSDNTVSPTDAVTGDSDIALAWEDAQSREALSLGKPVLPDWVSKQGLTLKVVISFTLTPQGFLTNITLKESCGYTDVDTAVINAVRKWRFKAVNTSKNVKGSVTYYIRPQ